MLQRQGKTWLKLLLIGFLFHYTSSWNPWSSSNYYNNNYYNTFDPSFYNNNNYNTYDYYNNYNTYDYYNYQNYFDYESLYADLLESKGFETWDDYLNYWQDYFNDNYNTYDYYNYNYQNYFDYESLFADLLESKGFETWDEYLDYLLDYFNDYLDNYNYGSNVYNYGNNAYNNYGSNVYNNYGSNAYNNYGSNAYYQPPTAILNYGSDYMWETLVPSQQQQSVFNTLYSSRWVPLLSLSGSALPPTADDLRARYLSEMGFESFEEFFISTFGADNLGDYQFYEYLGYDTYEDFLVTLDVFLYDYFYPADNGDTGPPVSDYWEYYSGSNWNYGNYGSNWNYGNYGSNWNYGNYGSNWNYGNYGSNWNYGNYGSNWNYGNYGSGGNYESFATNNNDDELYGTIGSVLFSSMLQENYGSSRNFQSPSWLPFDTFVDLAVSSESLPFATLNVGWSDSYYQSEFGSSFGVESDFVDDFSSFLNIYEQSSIFNFDSDNIMVEMSTFQSGIGSSLYGGFLPPSLFDTDSNILPTMASFVVSYFESNSFFLPPPGVETFYETYDGYSTSMLLATPVLAPELLLSYSTDQYISFNFDIYSSYLIAPNPAPAPAPAPELESYANEVVIDSSEVIVIETIGGTDEVGAPVQTAQQSFIESSEAEITVTAGFQSGYTVIGNVVESSSSQGGVAEDPETSTAAAETQDVYSESSVESSEDVQATTTNEGVEATAGASDNIVTFPPINMDSAGTLTEASITTYILGASTLIVIMTLTSFIRF